MHLACIFSQFPSETLVQRASWFDRRFLQLELPLPSAGLREAVVTDALSRVPTSLLVDPRAIAARATGLPMAGLDRVIPLAARLARAGAGAARAESSRTPSAL
jgi:hypothetical protein